MSPENGSKVKKSVMTKSIEGLAAKSDNTRNDDPPLDPNTIPKAGPGKDQG